MVNTKKASAHQNHGESADSPMLIDVKVVHRRYSDFVTLHKELIDQYLQRFIPSIPGKSYQDRLAEDDSTFVVDRIKQLQAFIDEVLMDGDLSESGIIYKFLSFNDRQYELLKSQMEQQQEKRTSMPKDVEQQPAQPASRFTSFLSNYFYVPTASAPINLIPEMLETEYQREVIEKLAELKTSIRGVSEHMKL